MFALQKKTLKYKIILGKALSCSVQKKEASCFFVHNYNKFEHPLLQFLASMFTSTIWTLPCKS